MKTFFRKATNIIVAFFMLISSCNGAFVAQTIYAADANITVDNQIGKNYYGFELTSVKDIPKINSTIMLFTHVKTGARLLYIFIW